MLCGLRRHLEIASSQQASPVHSVCPAFDLALLLAFAFATSFFALLLIFPPLVENFEEVLVAYGTRFVEEPFLPLYSELVLLRCRPLLGLHSFLFFFELLQGLAVLRLSGPT